MSKTETASSTATQASSGPVKRVNAAAPVMSPGPTLLPSASQHRPNGQLPNTPFAVSVISAALGGLVAASLAYLSVPFLQQLGSAAWPWARPQFALYGVAMGMFHLWEFWTTAGWNPNKLSVDGELALPELKNRTNGCLAHTTAFLLNNGLSYHIAHLAGVIEYIVSSYYWPQKFKSIWATPLFLLPGEPHHHLQLLWLIRKGSDAGCRGQRRYNWQRCAHNALSAKGILFYPSIHPVRDTSRVYLAGDIWEGVFACRPVQQLVQLAEGGIVLCSQGAGDELQFRLQYSGSDLL